MRCKSTTNWKESMKLSIYILDKCPLEYYLGKIHNQLRVKNDLIDYFSRIWKFEIIIYYVVVVKFGANKRPIYRYEVGN